MVGAEVFPMNEGNPLETTAGDEARPPREERAP